MRKKTRGEVTLTPCRMGSGPREGETASSRGFEERLYEAMGPREMDHDDGKRSEREGEGLEGGGWGKGFYEYRKVRCVHQTSAAHGWLELDMDSFKVVNKPGTVSCVWIFRSTQLERRGSCYWHLVGRGQGCC